MTTRTLPNETEGKCFRSIEARLDWLVGSQLGSCRHMSRLGAGPFTGAPQWHDRFSGTSAEVPAGQRNRLGQQARSPTRRSHPAQRHTTEKLPDPRIRRLAQIDFDQQRGANGQTPERPH